MAAQRYPSEPSIPAGGDISNAVLYGIVVETRREVYDRLDKQAEHSADAISDVHSGINDIKEMLADGQEKFGRLDERIKGEAAGREVLTRRVDDLESDVNKIPRPTGSKPRDESGANRLKTEKSTDFRIKLFNAVVLAAAAVIGTAIGGYIVKCLTLSMLADQQAALQQHPPSASPTHSSTPP